MPNKVWILLARNYVSVYVCREVDDDDEAAQHRLQESRMVFKFYPK